MEDRRGLTSSLPSEEEHIVFVVRLDKQSLTITNRDKILHDRVVGLIEGES